MGKLLWLASYPKSGNTWLRMFLLTLLRDPDEPLSINDVAKMTVTDIRRTDFERLSGVWHLLGKEVATVPEEYEPLQAPNDGFT